MAGRDQHDTPQPSARQGDERPPQGTSRTHSAVQKRTDEARAVWNHHGHDRRNCGITTMFLLTLIVVTVGGALMYYSARAAARLSPPDLGWMSAQWLAEHRAAHPS